MVEFKKSLIKRIWIIRLICMLCILLMVNQCFENFLGLPTPKEMFVSEFQMGLLAAMELCLILVMIQFQKGMKDESKLKDLYYSEHDERMSLIRQKSGYPTMWLASIMILLVAIIAGYFNVTVFITLVSVAVAQLIFGNILKFYYSRKY